MKQKIKEIVIIAGIFLLILNLPSIAFSEGQTLPSCTDFDGNDLNESIFTASKVTYIDENGNTTEYFDKCQNRAYLIEYICDGNQPKEMDYGPLLLTCYQNGCLNGACLREQDRTPPETRLVVTPAPNANGWNNTDVNAVLVAMDDNSAIADTGYCIDDTNECRVDTYYNNEQFSFTTGIKYVRYFSMNIANIIEDLKSTAVKIDKQKPLFRGFEFKNNYFYNEAFDLVFSNGLVDLRIYNDQLDFEPEGVDCGANFDYNSNSVEDYWQYGTPTDDNYSKIEYQYKSLGLKRIKMHCIDIAGNVNEQDILLRAIIIDTIPPDIKSVTISPEEKFLNKEITFTFDVNEMFPHDFNFYLFVQNKTILLKPQKVSDQNSIYSTAILPDSNWAPGKVNYTAIFKDQGSNESIKTGEFIVLSPKTDEGNGGGSSGGGGSGSGGGGGSGLPAQMIPDNNKTNSPDNNTQTSPDTNVESNANPAPINQDENKTLTQEPVSPQENPLNENLFEENNSRPTPTNAGLFGFILGTQNPENQKQTLVYSLGILCGLIFFVTVKIAFYAATPISKTLPKKKRWKK